MNTARAQSIAHLKLIEKKADAVPEGLQPSGTASICSMSFYFRVHLLGSAGKEKPRHFVKRGWGSSAQSVTMDFYQCNRNGTLSCLGRSSGDREVHVVVFFVCTARRAQSG
jgi:hypothetical protein